MTPLSLSTGIVQTDRFAIVPMCTTPDSESKLAILIVEDFDDNRELYAVFFEELGFAVRQASTGREALEEVAREAPDIIVMDLTMPDIDGWEAMQQLKARPESRHVPIVILTARATRDDIRRAREAGAAAVCVKPCVPQVLNESVCRRLRISPRTLPVADDEEDE